MHVTLHLTPPNPRDILVDQVAVVIDVCRATTTIISALANGAQAIIPVKSVAEARRVFDHWRSQRPDDTLLLAGERHAKRIPGFNLGNSPVEFNNASLLATTIILTTSHGTRALLRSSYAERVLIGGFVNISSVAAMVNALNQDVAIICSGTDGHLSVEDTLCAGALLTRITDSFSLDASLDDAAVLAKKVYSVIGKDPATLLDFVMKGKAARRIASIGLAEDVIYSLLEDVTKLVPEYFADTNTVIAHSVNRSVDDVR